MKYEAPPGLRVRGSRATEIIPAPSAEAIGQAFLPRLAMRNMSIDEFIETRGSGTLRKNAAIGMNTTSHALHERVAYEFGYAFEALPERFVAWGEARSEGDCKPITEAGWHVERYASVSLFPGDEIECKFIEAEVDGVRREGIGIVVRKTSAPWLPRGYIVFSIIAEYSREKGVWLPAVNPC